MVFGNWSLNKVETRLKLVDTLSVAALYPSLRHETFHSFRENSGERDGSSDDEGRRNSFYLACEQNKGFQGEIAAKIYQIRVTPNVVSLGVATIPKRGGKKGRVARREVSREKTRFSAQNRWRITR